MSGRPSAELRANGPDALGASVCPDSATAGGTPAPAAPAATERHPGHDAAGRFTPGNRDALIHGRRSERHLAALTAAAREALAARRAEIAVDLGGDLSRLQADIVERYIAASALLVWLEDRLLREGAITAKGRKRSAFDAYLGLLDRVGRLAVLLGLERRARQVDLARQLSGLED